MITVVLPLPLQRFTNFEPEVEVEGNTIQEALSDLDEKFSGIGKLIYQGGPSIQKYLSVYKNEEDIQFLDGEETSVKSGDRISIVSAVSGG